MASFESLRAKPLCPQESLDTPDGEQVATLAADLLARCDVLLSELTSFEKRLVELGKAKQVELRTFTSSIRAEAKSLSRIREMDNRTEEQRLHMLRSANVSFYEAVWLTATHSRGVTGFFKRFQYNHSIPAISGHTAQSASKENGGSDKCKRSGAFVDIVADNGAEWVKLSTITETRLVFEIARRGWERDLGDSSESEHESHEGNGDDGDESMEDDISILKAAEDLIRASKAMRVRYRHPRVRMVLPKIMRGKVEAIDNVLNGIQALGVEVQTADLLNSSRALHNLSITEALSNLVLDDSVLLTATVNIDCTIILAIVSDLSNMEVEKEPWLHAAAKRQIEMEEEQKLLPSVLLPAMGARKLVCTRQAAARAQEIIDTIGTDSEKSRAQAVLLDLPDSQNREDRLAAFSALSDHKIPDSWQLPIEVVDTAADLLSGLPQIAMAVKMELSELNQSVFLYGWQQGITTMTSNRTIVRRIQSIIDESLEAAAELDGPAVWLCDTARSLRAKDKHRNNNTMPRLSDS